jgi:hypothetical protein
MSKKKNKHHKGEKKRRKKLAQQPEPTPAINLRSSDGQIALKTALKLVRPIVGLVSLYAVIKVFLEEPEAATLAAVLACLTVVYDVFDLVNWKRATYLRERGLWPPLATYFCWFLGMVGVAVVGFAVSASSWEGILVVAAFVVVALGRARVQGEICSQLSALGLETSKPIWGKNVAERIDRLINQYAHRELGEAAGLVDVALQKLANWIRDRPLSPHRDVRRVVALAVIVAALLLGGWTGVVLAVEGVQRGVEEVKRGVALLEPSHSTAHTKTSDVAKRPAGSTAAASEPTLRASAPSPSTSEASTSPGLQSQCAVSPGAGAPSWARRDILHLYLGGGGSPGGEAPGTVVAGCPGKIEKISGRDGVFVYTLGEGPTSSQPLSIAVDSKRFGPALFLAPAVKPVLALIHQFGAVGGMHRFLVGTGGFYPVQTHDGTYILIRRESGTEQQAKAYTLIPPVVAQAWSLATGRSETFLWPVPRQEKEGVTYRFYTDTTPARLAYSFSYRPSDTTEPELGEAELQEDADRAG